MYLPTGNLLKGLLNMRFTLYLRSLQSCLKLNMLLFNGKDVNLSDTVHSFTQVTDKKVYQEYRNLSVLYEPRMSGISIRPHNNQTNSDEVLDGEHVIVKCEADPGNPPREETLVLEGETTGRSFSEVGIEEYC